jgi:hypothetical protein
MRTVTGLDALIESKDVDVGCDRVVEGEENLKDR